MGMRVPSSFQEHFATLTDPRCPHAPNSRHRLMDILVIAVCAVIGGAEGWEDIEEYGKAQAAWFADCWTCRMAFQGMTPFGGSYRAWTPRN